MSDIMINIGVIGYGYWGPNIVRNFMSSDGCQVKTIVDLRSERLITIKKTYPRIHTSKLIADIINDKQIDGVVIATPSHTHFDLAKKMLTSGKHVLVEKPLATSITDAERLIDLSFKYKKTLMVDHTFLYSGAVKKIKDLITKRDIGKIKYFDSTRINLGLFQQDINVLWDLAPHDISILLFLVRNKPQSVQAIGISHLKNGIEDVAYLIIKFNSGLIAHFNCSWFSPIKVRLMMIGGDKKMIVWNDMEPTEKVKIYDSGYCAKIEDKNKKKYLIDYRIGDIYVPKIELIEALHGVAVDFINSIKFNTKPVSNWEIGLQVVKILELAQKSIKNHGKEIKWHE